jgi:hypothetical protein
MIPLFVNEYLFLCFLFSKMYMIMYNLYLAHGEMCHTVVSCKFPFCSWYGYIVTQLCIDAQFF